HNGAGYADVDGPAACQWLAASCAPVLVHGHTHRPAQHALGVGLERWVLSDWDTAATPPRGDALRISANGLERIQIA
ncbi:MAG: UDP-2,3-diacylglucosamine diphosphatase, partial [Burkholderiales bacterium]|nr:UDP-2,3-diacylglucosamine diphosphatase [Burkholderiales bacterium]